MSKPLWKLQNVTRLGGPQRRLVDVSLEIASGSTAVLGLSGAGKTSLLNLLVGFEQADAGTMQFQPTEVGELPLYWVPADGGLWPHLTVWQHLEVVSAEPEDWLRRFDLLSVVNSSPAKLSMGERSRLAVARGLAAEPRVLVMDEPLLHVDAARLRTYWDVIQHVCDEQNMSLVFASHDPEMVLRQAQHVLCLESGRVLWQGATQELYRSPVSEHLGWFLGPVNWFEPTAARVWLQLETVQPVALRPEQIEVLPATNGPCVVEFVRSAGSVGEVYLSMPGEMTESNTPPRRVYHRPGGSVLQSGMRAVLKACLLLMLACGLAFISGCNNGQAAPAMPVSEFNVTRFPAEGARLPAPRAVTFGPTGELFALDDVGRVLVYDVTGKLNRTWWMPEYTVGRPEGVWVMLDGRLVIADTHYNRCVFTDMAGNVLGMFGSFGEAPGQFIYPIAITQDANGYLYVAENGGNDRIQKFTDQGEFVLSIGKCGVEPGEFQRPSGVVWRKGKLYVADAFNNRILRFADTGEFEQVIADADTAGLYYPYDLAEGPEETLYVVEYGAGRVTHIDLQGRLLGKYGQVGRGDGEFWTPWGLAVRNDGAVFVADTGNRRLVELKP